MVEHLRRSDTGELADLNILIRPPTGLWSRLVHYSQRYGVVHAVLSYIGRHSRWFWRLVGKQVTRPYLRQWLQQFGPRILNLGGGGVLSEHWLTADIDPRSDVWVDLRRALPFENDALDAVFSEEAIEHIDQHDAYLMLQEVYRVLKPRGWLRLTTPSLDWFANRALADVRFVREMNQVFYDHGHRYIYSEAEMEALLHKVGFSIVKKSSFRDPKANFGHFDTHALRFPEAPAECSQYWEAQKP